MIAYLLRTLPLALRARYRSSNELVSRISLRVSLRQIDLNRHMNQAQYPAVMELGRTDLLFGNDSWSTWQEDGLNPVVAEQTVQYRRELKPFQRFVVDSRVVDVEGRFLVLEHHIVVGERVHAKAVVKLLFVGESGVLSAERVEVVGRPWCTGRLGVVNWVVES